MKHLFKKHQAIQNMHVCMSVGTDFWEASLLKAEYTLLQVCIELKENIFENGKLELYISVYIMYLQREICAQNNKTRKFWG